MGDWACMKWNGDIMVRVALVVCNLFRMFFMKEVLLFSHSGNKVESFRKLRGLINKNTHLFDACPITISIEALWKLFLSY